LGFGGFAAAAWSALSTRATTKEKAAVDSKQFYFKPIGLSSTCLLISSSRQGEIEWFRTSSPKMLSAQILPIYTLLSSLISEDSFHHNGTE
jgi:hypothetical protein